MTNKKLKQTAVRFGKISMLVIIASIITLAVNAQSKYSIGDKGPGGGWIFYAENGGFMEVSVSLGEHTYNNAVSVARNYRGGGFSDWRLPDKEELNMIYVNLRKGRKVKIAGIAAKWHWSSTSYSCASPDGCVWVQHLGSGDQFDYVKFPTLKIFVLAVRAFTP